MVRTHRRQSPFINQNHLASDSMDGNPSFCKLQPIVPENLTYNIREFYWKDNDTAKTRDTRIWEAVLFAICQLVWVYSHQVGRILGELKDVWAAFMIDGYWAKEFVMTYGGLSDYIKRAQKKILEVVTPPKDEVVPAPVVPAPVVPAPVVPAPVVTVYDRLLAQLETQQIEPSILEILEPWCAGTPETGEIVKTSRGGVNRIVINFGSRDYDRVFYAYDDGHYEVHKLEYAGGFSRSVTTQLCSTKPRAFKPQESWQEWYVKRNPHTTIKFNKTY
jgi:hypothetical protein